MKVRQVDLAYMAGFFDGEGSVYMKIIKNSLHLEVSTSQNTRTVLILFERYFGGTIHSYQPKTRKSDIFLWKVYGANAVAFLEAIKGHLIVKRYAADCAITAYTERDKRDAVVDEYRTWMTLQRSSR